MPDQREMILGFITYNGPVLPVRIAKHLHTNILFASAMLSELVSSRLLKITHGAIGGSPLYYLIGQEDKMDSRLSSSLGGKEKEAYNLLKDKKILREQDLEPWQRIAVKNLTDFTSPISVKEGENIETFWKYHLINDDEAKQTISDLMKTLYNSQEQVQQIVNNISKQETSVQEILTEELEKPEEKLKPIAVKEPKVIVEKPKVKKEPKKFDVQFYSKIIDFIKENSVEVLKEEIIKKDKEFDFVVNINSNFGKLRYLIKAKNKNIVNEADITMAFSEGQIKKMPVILLFNGKVNKKASLLVEQKMQGQLTLKSV